MGLPPKSTVFRNSCTVFAPVGRFQKFKMQTKAEFWARLVRTSISSNSSSAKFYIETTCGRMGFQHFSSNHFFSEIGSGRRRRPTFGLRPVNPSLFKVFPGDCDAQITRRPSEAKTVQYKKQTPPRPSAN